MSTLRARASRWVSRWRNSRFWPSLTLTRRIGSVLFEVDLEPHSISLPLCFGYYEPLTVKALRRLLTRGDTVFDVGANVGYLSAVAADAVGPTGQVHSFEPVPRYFRKLRRLAELNPDYTIVPNAVAVGDREGSGTIRTSMTNLGGHTMVPELRHPDDLEAEMEVPTITLDAYIERAAVSRLALVKIDVEGFEFPVLRGISRFLAAGQRPYIIAEIHPEAYPLLGYALTDLAGFIRGFDYAAFALDAVGEIDVTTVNSLATVVFASRSSQMA